MSDIPYPYDFNEFEKIWIKISKMSKLNPNAKTSIKINLTKEGARKGEHDRIMQITVPKENYQPHHKEILNMIWAIMSVEENVYNEENHKGATKFYNAIKVIHDEIKNKVNGGKIVK